MYNPTITLPELQATVGFEHESLCRAYEMCTSPELAETILDLLDASHSKVLQTCLDTFFLPEEQTVLEAYVDAVGHYEDACEFISIKANFHPHDLWLGRIFEIVSSLHNIIEDFRFNDFKILANP